MTNEWTETKDDPTKKGWYAFVICYDKASGDFVAADHWTGDPPAWLYVYDPRVVVKRSIQDFPTRNEALNWGAINK